MAGHKRMAYPNSVIMLHDGSIYAQGTAGQVKDMMDFNLNTEERAKTFILAHTNITSEKYKSMLRVDWWMNAAEALELGIIDEIIR